jgi:hypothetical protein
MAVTVSRLCPLVPLVSECWWQCRALAHEDGSVTALGEHRGFQARGPEQCVTLGFDAVSLGNSCQRFEGEVPPFSGSRGPIRNSGTDDPVVQLHIPEKSILLC